MGRINAFRIIEVLERMNILGGQNTESVNTESKGRFVRLFKALSVRNLRNI